MKRITIFISVLFLLLYMIELRAQDAQILLGKMDQVMFSAKDKQGTVEIILNNRQGKEKIREAVFMQKGDKSLYRYTKPESQEGVATLSLPDGVMWLYMPAFGKPKKISLLAKSQAFTGTDFSYEDMSTLPYSERYTPKLIGTKSDSYVLELTPKSDNSKYTKIILTLNNKYYYPVKMEYFNRAGQKFKEATYVYEKVGDYWNAKQVIMVDLNKQHMTKILLSNVKFNQGIPDEVFTVENLMLKKKEE